MSKCAQNMMGKLFALDVKPKGIAIVCLHPGFMKTSMTAIYADKYDELGAIGPDEAAPGLVKVPPPCFCIKQQVFAVFQNDQWSKLRKGTVGGKRLP